MTKIRGRWGEASTKPQPMGNRTMRIDSREQTLIKLTFEKVNEKEVFKIFW